MWQRSFVNLFLLALMCVMCAVGDHILEVRYYRENAYWEAFADRRVWGAAGPL